MRLLLDTHTFLWFVAGNRRLSGNVREKIADTTNPAFISAASLWEIAIKISTGKLVMEEPFDTFITQQLQLNEIEILPITFAHIVRVAALPFHHRDPFDRLLVAQALVEGLSIVSADPLLDAYPIARLW